MLFDFVLKMVCCIWLDGLDEDVGLDVVVVGDCLCVCFGEKVLVDGELVEG